MARPGCSFLKSAGLAALLLLAADRVCLAETAAVPPANPDLRLKELKKAMEEGRAEHEQIRRKAETQAKELESIKSDMVQTAHAVQEHEDRLSELERQLNELDRTEKEKSSALDLKRQQTNGVLTALQRLAFRPSEALIAQPTSPADTVRSAILLRTVLPLIHKAANALRTDLDNLSAVRSDIARQRQKISSVTADLDSQHRKLSDLFSRKQQIQQETQSQQRENEQHLAAMAAEARDLHDLMARLEEERKRREREAAEKAAAVRAAEKAARDARIAAEKAARDAQTAAAKAARDQRKPEEDAARQAKETEERARRTAQAAQETADEAAESQSRQLASASAPPRSFTKAQGEMPFPARGIVIAKFGQTDEAGSPSRGITIETRPNAQVVAPYDGRVVFAGPFRGYGLLLIIEHAEGYHTLLSGMDRIDGAVGQHLLAGEPVGTMGPSENKPLLYVELRHDGQPVDPLSWLTARKTKVSG